MRKIALVFVVVIVAGVASLSAQTSDRPTIQPNTLYISADGKFEAVPDTVVLQFSISAQEEASKDAYARATRATEQIRDLLKMNGLDPKSAEIGYFALSPVYDYRSPKRKLVGYRVNSNVTLKLKDFTKVGPIVQQLSTLDVTDSQSITYMLDTMDEAKIKATEDAFRRARGEASALAQVGGRALGEMLYASVDTFERQPIIMPMAKMAMAGAEQRTDVAPTDQFSPQKITVTAHVSVLFAIK